MMNVVGIIVFLGEGRLVIGWSLRGFFKGSAIFFFYILGGEFFVVFVF